MKFSWLRGRPTPNWERSRFFVLSRVRTLCSSGNNVTSPCCRFPSFLTSLDSCVLSLASPALPCVARTLSALAAVLRSVVCSLPRWLGCHTATSQLVSPCSPGRPSLPCTNVPFVMQMEAAFVFCCTDTKFAVSTG